MALSLMEWLDGLTASDPVPQGTLVDLLFRLRELAMQGSYGEIDAVLAIADPDRIPETASITLLRGNFPWRIKLDHWIGFRDRFEAFLDRKGAPTARILAGLYERGFMTEEQAIRLMMEAHEGQLDKAGKPYYLHPIAVARRVKALLPLSGLTAEEGEDAVVGAIFHDVDEDTRLKIEELRHRGVSPGAVEIVRLLSKTRHPGTTYAQRIDIIAESGNVGAILAKHCDNMENSDPERVAQLAPEERSIVRRYERSMARLEEAAPFLAEARSAPSPAR